MYRPESDPLMETGRLGGDIWTNRAPKIGNLTCRYYYRRTRPWGSSSRPCDHLTHGIDTSLVSLVYDPEPMSRCSGKSGYEALQVESRPKPEQSKCDLQDGFKKKKKIRSKDSSKQNWSPLEIRKKKNLPNPTFLRLLDRHLGLVF